MRPSFMAIMLTAACSTQAVAQVADVEQMPERFIEYFRQGDVEGLTSLFTADASYIPIVGPRRLEGAKEISGYYARVISESRARNITFQNARWRKFDNVAVRTADVVIDLDLPDGKRRSTPSRVSFVYLREAAGWKIVHYHGSPGTGPATAAPAAAQPNNR